MLKEDFMVGPFEICPNANGCYSIYYGPHRLAHNIDAGSAETRQQVIEGLGDCLAGLRDHMRALTTLYKIQLVRGDTGAQVAAFWSEYPAIEGMLGAIPNDQHEYWLKCGLRAMPVSLNEFAEAKNIYQAPPQSWIGNRLPCEVMTGNPDEWRPPNAFEIRHVVGEGSFTGISGAKAAELVGISPANFRKYLASDSAKNRQHISFAAWHLLLQRLEVTRPLGSVAS